MSQAQGKVRKAAAGAAERAPLPAPPPAHPRAASARPRPAEEVLPRLLGQAQRGEGVRVGWLGNTGSGKTFAAAWLVDEMRRRRFVDVALIVDDKSGRPPYHGLERVNPEDLRAHPPRDDEDKGAVIYRGVALDPGRTVDVDEVAAQAWQIVQQPSHPTVVLAIDELRRAVSPAGREWRAPHVARALSEGRAPGLSVSWTTQAPQRVPVEAFDQSDLCIFTLGFRGRAYLERERMVPPRVAELVGTLATRQFVVVDHAGEWDGHVYEIPFRRA